MTICVESAIVCWLFLKNSKDQKLNFFVRFLLLVWTVSGLFCPLAIASTEDTRSQPSGMKRISSDETLSLSDLRWQTSDSDSDVSESLSSPAESLPDCEKPELFRTSSFKATRLTDLAWAWDEYLSGKWFNVFKKISLKPDAVIIEFAPGTSKKVGLALKKISFRGTLYIVEPEPESIKFVANSYRNLLPYATIIEIPYPLGKVMGQLPELGNKVVPDLLISNHGLDDMISGQYFDSMEEMNDFFNQHYPDPGDLKAQEIDARISANVWKNIVNNNHARSLRSKVLRELQSFIRSSGVRHIALSTYESHFFYKWSEFYPSLNYAYLEARRVMKKLERWLLNYNRPGYKRIHMLHSEVLQSAEMWYVFRLNTPKISPFEIESADVESKKSSSFKFRRSFHRAISKIIGKIGKWFS